MILLSNLLSEGWAAAAAATEIVSILYYAKVG